MLEQILFGQKKSRQDTEILTAHAESTDVGKDIECARGVVAVHAGNGGQTFQQRRAAAREDVAQLRAQLRMVKCGNRGVLTDGICAGIEVFLTFGHAVDDLRGASQIADAPAGHGVGF